ncbi:MAG TPA: silent information regulator protein Sir2, partial [Verrucomicrobiota bacterium]|nr:silent information regulator protein Sir2 [Verrucomicrobiota bacterium]
STAHANGVWTVAGGGSDIWNAADQFRFVHQPLSADGEIIARVTSLQNTDPWAKAGVMIRETLNGNSRHAFMGITPANGFAWQRRTATGGSSEHTAGGSLNAAPGNWVRLTRQGNTLRAYKSANGINWTQVGSALNIGMASEIYIGLAVTSHNNGTVATAVFDSITVVP